MYSQAHKTDKIQETTVNITLHNRDVNISAIYCPPKHAISTEEFNKFFKSYKTKFIALGDLNAKHNYWDSRTNNPKGKNFYQCIKINNLKIYAPGRPTYWLSDPNKTLDILDITVTNTNLNDVTEKLLDLSSDHTLTIYTIDQKVAKDEKTKLTNATMD